MSRLYSDQLQSTGRRFYFALDGAPGIITPATASLSMLGQVPVAVEPSTVFRTPTPALLTLQGALLGASVVLTPTTGSLSTVGQIPSDVRSLTISPALPAPAETPPSPFSPTLITIWTTEPATGLITIQSLELNVTQGGNIGFVSPAQASVSLGTQPFTLLLGGVIGAGSISVVGLAPSLTHELTISPDVGALTIPEMLPTLALPFRWIDDDPAATSPWITDVAA